MELETRFVFRPGNWGEPETNAKFVVLQNFPLTGKLRKKFLPGTRNCAEESEPSSAGSLPQDHCQD